MLYIYQIYLLSNTNNECTKLSNISGKRKNQIVLTYYNIPWNYTPSSVSSDQRRNIENLDEIDRHLISRNCAHLDQAHSTS